MKQITALIVLLVSLSVQAEPIVNSIEGVSGTDTEQRVPTSFYIEYVKNNELILLFDQCDKADLSLGWIAKVKQLDTGNEAPGCWHRLYQMVRGGEIIEWWVADIEVRKNEYIGYSFKAKEFTPRFE